MIRYALSCDQKHQSESWFPSAEAFAKLQSAGLLACAFCGSSKVEKMLMAPAVRPARKAATPMAKGADANTADAKTPNRALSNPASAAEAALMKLRQEVEKNSEYVGMNFASEARAMHDGSAPERAIYGEAKPEEARLLIEEGVPVAPLPFMPSRKVN
ncbi:MAG: DUF1178 family protein [Albidovulum sp.]